VRSRGARVAGGLHGLLPIADAQGILMDEDVFRIVS
jgi:hypothetical protein